MIDEGIVHLTYNMNRLAISTMITDRYCTSVRQKNKSSSYECLDYYTLLNEILVRFNRAQKIHRPYLRLISADDLKESLYDISNYMISNRYIRIKKTKPNICISATP